MENLSNTGIGRIVNNLRGKGGLVEETAKSLVIKWKHTVVTELTNEYYGIENHDSS